MENGKWQIHVYDENNTLISYETSQEGKFVRKNGKWVKFEKINEPMYPNINEDDLDDLDHLNRTPRPGFR